ncbi:MAG: CHRD domain-containing protein, partial [Rhodospirillales bacterium]|nr:CHRD domain-containing protein [Rhodospirillales bacterium]
MAALIGASMLSIGVARAETVMFQAKLTGGAEVPATPSKGTGTLMATLDTTTKTLSWTVTYSGLTGPAIGGHFHG